MNIYQFAGLGADERLFSKIKIPKVNFIFVPYIDVLKDLNSEEKESIESYSKRFAETIFPKPVAGDCFMGVSLGGVIATELAKYFLGIKVILISSVKTRHEFPPFFQLFHLFNPDFSNPAKIISQFNFLSTYFGIENTSELDLMDSMLRATRIDFFNWSKKAIVSWKNDIPPADYIHLHGSKDYVFPIQYISKPIVLPGMGHFMVYTNGKMISEILEDKLGFR